MLYASRGHFRRHGINIVPFRFSDRRTKCGATRNGMQMKMDRLTTWWSLAAPAAYMCCPSPMSTSQIHHRRLDSPKLVFFIGSRQKPSNGSRQDGAFNTCWRRVSQFVHTNNVPLTNSCRHFEDCFQFCSKSLGMKWRQDSCVGLVTTSSSAIVRQCRLLKIFIWFLFLFK